MSGAPERPRLPPGQKITEKFPVMTAGTPKIATAADWSLTLSRETEDGSVTDLAVWDMAAFRALPQTEITCDLHCVTRWSKLDTRWRGVALDDLFAAAVVQPSEDYVLAACDGDYAANLKRRDLAGENAFVALDYDAGAGFAPIPEQHGGPARLMVPALYLWKSAKWLRRLTLSPYDRKGFWEKLGYHNHGDPWKEQRYRGISETDWRRTLDTELSRKIREERRTGKRGES